MIAEQDRAERSHSEWTDIQTKWNARIQQTEHTPNVFCSSNDGRVQTSHLVLLLTYFVRHTMNILNDTAPSHKAVSLQTTRGARAPISRSNTDIRRISTWCCEGGELVEEL